MSRFSEPNSFVMEPSAPANPAERMAVILAELTPTQAEAAMLQGAVLVLAGAGTGKTRTLTAGVASRIAVRGIPPSHILAVTFTNKAAKEMADRVRSMRAGVAVASPGRHASSRTSHRQIALLAGCIARARDQRVQSAFPPERSPNWIAWNCCAASNPTKAGL